MHETHLESLVMNEKISEILIGLRDFDGTYKRELVDAAIELKDEITPYLIEVLENLLSDPNKYIENPDLFDHTYAVMHQSEKTADDAGEIGASNTGFE